MRVLIPDDLSDRYFDYACFDKSIRKFSEPKIETKDLSLTIGKRQRIGAAWDGHCAPFAKESSWSVSGKRLICVEKSTDSNIGHKKVLHIFNRVGDDYGNCPKLRFEYNYKTIHYKKGSLERFQTCFIEFYSGGTLIHQRPKNSNDDGNCGPKPLTHNILTENGRCFSIDVLTRGFEEFKPLDKADCEKSSIKTVFSYKEYDHPIARGFSFLTGIRPCFEVDELSNGLFYSMEQDSTQKCKDEPINDSTRQIATPAQSSRDDNSEVITK